MNDNNKNQFPMDVPAIQKLLPHRYPFLLVDRVLEARAGEYVLAIKNVSATDGYLAGHFPGNPVMPGVLQVEAIAQAAAVLGFLTLPDVTEVYLTEITSARFRRPVVPGDVLRLEVNVTNNRKNFFWFDGTASVDGQVALAVKFSAVMK